MTATKPKRANLHKLAAGIPDAFLRCRKGRSHHLVEDDLDRVRKWGRELWEVTHRCTDCGTRVIAWAYLDGTPVPNKRRYIYPDGYYAPGIEGRGAELRAILRRNTYRQMEQRKRQATRTGNGAKRRTN